MERPIKKVLCLGELLVRLQSSQGSFFSNSTGSLKMYAGGSEANVAVTLANLGIETAYFTSIPNNALTQEIIQILDSNHIDTSKILYQGDRIGSYYLLSANGLTSGQVIYDRNYSSFSKLNIQDINWDDLFNDIDLLHITAITPAINQNLADFTLAVLEKAAERNIYISIDLNYRNKLWQYGKEPDDIMPAIVNYVDIVMGNIWASNKMLGTKIDSSLNRETSKQDYVQYAEQVAHELFEKFPKLKHVANTYRFMDNANHNLFYGTYHNRTTTTYSETRETNQVVDRIGSGDAFMGGLLYALIKNMTPQQIIDTASAAGFEKLFVEGDFGNGKI